MDIVRFLGTCPVLPSQDIDRDVVWYKKHTGFKSVHRDAMYAVLKRDVIYLHLQWHADTKQDPLLGGSVVKIFVDDVRPLYQEFVERGTVEKEQLRLKTA